MPPIRFESVCSLEENEDDVYSAAVTILLKVTGNILKEPNNLKYRSISLANNAVTSKLLPALGAMECLFEMGFVEADDRIQLPKEASLDILRKIQNQLNESIERKQKLVKQVEPVASTSKASDNLKPCVKIETKETLKLNVVREELDNFKLSVENPFISKLVSLSNQVLNYENHSLKAKALRIIPLVDLNLNVEKQYRQLQKAAKLKNDKSLVFDYQELLLLELLDWFKNKFFKWMDQPECERCKIKKPFVETRRQVNGDRVEVYKCGGCGSVSEYTRYNDPGTLLDTRLGRCGEWANCFTLLCRALNWDARIAYDETDHVWTEVYLELRKTWVHCDPCENKMDAPLMYETGWRKELSYVIAYSRDGPQDVTWRYTTQSEQVRTRRKACSEQQLVDAMLALRNIMLAHESQARRDYFVKRYLFELVDLMKTRTASEVEQSGRTSGSLAWRLARGEVHVDPHVWKVTEEDVKDNSYRLEYCTSTDEYRTNSKRVPGWNNGAFKANGVIRKEEKDWKMVYLCRQEGTAMSGITWRVSCGSRKIKEVQLRFEKSLFESGRVLCTLCSGQQCVKLNEDVLKTDAFEGNSELTVTAVLSGGDGDCAWQHAQLFRQELSSHHMPFSLVIIFQ